VRTASPVFAGTADLELFGQRSLRGALSRRILATRDSRENAFDDLLGQRHQLAAGEFGARRRRFSTGQRDVFGFGEQKNPESFRQACRRFVYTENLLTVAANNQDAASTLKSLQPPSIAVAVLL
jgi:hypothetical protein